MFQNNLKNAGLTDNESKVYVAALELREAHISKIAKKSGIKRTTAYLAVDSLKEKGLISTIKKKSKTLYYAEDPRKIINLAKEKVKLLEESLPILNALYGTAKIMPAVRFYESKTGMKMILEEILDEAKEILGFSSAEDYIATLEDYWPKFLERRLKKKIPVRSILKESPKAEGRKKFGPEQLRQVRIIPASYEHHSIIAIWKNKIAMFSFQDEMVALVIESKELAQSQRAMFNLIWDLMS